jgi:hypothetical protein
LGQRRKYGKVGSIGQKGPKGTEWRSFGGPLWSGNGSRVYNASKEVEKVKMNKMRRQGTQGSPNEHQHSTTHLAASHHCPTNAYHTTPHLMQPQQPPPRHPTTPPLHRKVSPSTPAPSSPVHDPSPPDSAFFTLRCAVLCRDHGTARLLP